MLCLLIYSLLRLFHFQIQILLIIYIGNNDEIFFKEFKIKSKSTKFPRVSNIIEYKNNSKILWNTTEFWNNYTLSSSTLVNDFEENEEKIVLKVLEVFRGNL